MIGTPLFNLDTPALLRRHPRREERSGRNGLARAVQGKIAVGEQA